MVLLVLVPFALVLFFYGLGSYSLVDADEAFYQGVAESMVESGDWLTIEFRGVPRSRDAFLNAPYHYWARAALISVFGSNLWTVRITSALFSMGVLGLVCLWAYRLAGSYAALIAGALLLTTYQFVCLHGARTGELEPLVAFFLLLAAITFSRTLEKGQGFVPHHLCLVALMGLKSPLVLIPLFSDLVVLIGFPAARKYFWPWAKSALFVLPLGLIWPAVQVWGLGDEAWSGINSLIRNTGEKTEGSNSMQNLRFYLYLVLVGSFPWSLLVPFSCLYWIKSPRLRAPERFAALVYPVILLLFYIAIHKMMPWYISPLYPFFAIWVGVGLCKLGSLRSSAWTLCGVAAMIVIVLLLEVVSTGAANQIHERAKAVDFRIGWRPLLGSGPVLACALVAALTSGLLVARRHLDSRLTSILAVGLAIIVVSLGGVRIAEGLRDLGHRSKLLEFRLAIDQGLLAGKRLHFPIPLPRERIHKFLVAYYFGDDFVFTEGDLSEILIPGRYFQQATLAGFRKTRNSSGQEEQTDFHWLGHPGRVR
jgi:4-amino-4-deoxy-L-arabinose transferase-like glycosyltransferase